LTIGVGGAAAQADRGGRPAASGFRGGSLPARLTEWAKGHKRDFGVADVMNKFKLTRSHASMVLSRVAGAGSVHRAGRGVYRV
jgi:hypothetical protein